MTQHLYKNWVAICELTDPVLRMAVSGAQDEETLKGFSVGFPQLFTTEEQRVHKFPLSLLSSAWVTDGRAEDKDHFKYDDRHEVLEHFKIPFLFFSEEKGDQRNGYPAFPEELKELETVDLFEDEPVIFSYMGQDYYVVQICCGEHAWVTPVACIDLEA